MNKYTSAVIAVVILAVVFVLVTQLQGGKPATKNNQPTTTNSQMLDNGNNTKLRAEIVENSKGIGGYFTVPEAPGTYPGVVMVHEWWGLNDHMRDMAEQLAREGYAVLAVDLHKGKVATTPEQAKQYVGELKAAEAIENMQNAVKYLQSKGATKIASLGWCFGGGQALQLAVSGQKLDATVLYYGTPVTEAQKLALIKWPVLGIFGEVDTSIPVAKVNEFHTAMDDAGITNSVHIYPGVGHAFANPSGANYASEATRDAWAKTLAFLNQHLKTPTALR
jgi:carboxymethylenebutenolidase